MILLDTHVLVRYANADRKLGKRARADIDHALGHDELFVSARTFVQLATAGLQLPSHVEPAIASRESRACDSDVTGLQRESNCRTSIDDPMR
jgi:predicted nucleic acid-binding protein